MDEEPRRRKYDWRVDGEGPPPELPPTGPPPVIRTGTYWLRATVCLLVIGVLIGLVSVVSVSQTKSEADRTTIGSLKQQIQLLQLQIESNRQQLSEADDATICRSALAAATSAADAEADIAKAIQASAFDALVAGLLARNDPDQLAAAQQRLTEASTALASAADNYREAVRQQRAVIRSQQDGTYVSCPVQAHIPTTGGTP